MNRMKFQTDILLFLGIFLLSISKLTGITAHEWISIPVTAVLLWHLALNWDLLTGGFKNFKKLSAENKFNFIWDILLYWVIAVTLFSGFITSRALLPALGCPIENDAFFSFLHKRFPTILTIMIGIHLGMHIVWLKARFTRSKREENKE